MENFYLILIVVLFALAISDLIVGVSNDAVNFLNSAIGSRAASKWLIYLMAAAGVFIGATFSSGMMEVARKGIFHPEMFYFPEIIVIFLAVMITDVILLDTFNTFGLPTSTTVSLVFELLGSAVVVSLVKINQLGQSFFDLYKYINSEKALVIITGILVSVVIAFTVGAFVQYIVRLIFTFNYHRPLKYFGSAFGGIAIMFIFYFILIKGIEGSVFAELKLKNGIILEDWVNSNSSLILMVVFAGCMFLLQVLKWLFNIKILKIVILAGTFALAMAFAGNDLVNFIGVPVAGYNSYIAWVSSGVPAESFTMEILGGKVDTPSYMLLISGLVMIITLIFSKKAKSVIATSLDLSRQSEGAERFGTSLGARLIVRNSTRFVKKFEKFTPLFVRETIKSRFIAMPPTGLDSAEAPSFDKIRAAVNLVVAAILISFGTSLKLPLSTTYVTFMVAMGTSLADGAWDRDSAVYRVSGVFTVIGGWFLTAVIAFVVSGFVALCISLGGNFMIFVFLGITVFIAIKSHIFFKKHNENEKLIEDLAITENDPIEAIVNKSKKQSARAFVFTKEIISLCVRSFIREDRNGLKQAETVSAEFSKKAKKNKDNVYSTVNKMAEKSVDTSHFIVQIMDYKREMAHALHFLVRPVIVHSDNNHKPFSSEQADEFVALVQEMDSFCDFAIETIRNESYENMGLLVAKREEIFDLLQKMERTQIKRIKTKEVNTRNSQLYFKIISEIRSLLLHSVNLVKSQRDFITYTKTPKSI